MFLPIQKKDLFEISGEKKIKKKNSEKKSHFFSFTVWQLKCGSI